ncbi:MAG: 4-hydroxythreonine-4-phosphate dehydrogenase PdxA [Acidiferrobacterales bacterium]|nr:4-hydroxythreonine-4-phosphate dehydrogenase PdxA [Acidiferrobacterales bacterium]
MAYTVGEPAGIGPDIIIQLAQQQRLADIVCVGDVRLLKQRAAELELPLRVIEPHQNVDDKSQLRALDTPIQEINLGGTPTTSNVEGVLSMLDAAIDGCIVGEFAAMVTGPLHKAIINDAGVNFSGHTEYLAERTKAPLPVMLLASEKMRVALVTTHLPLKEVSAAISKDLIKRICRIVHTDLQNKYAIKVPRQLICGLNPHAGEGGHLGMEEIETIIPALNELRDEGLDVVGPLPADTLFTDKYLQDADVVIAMYHDQGLPVLKSQSFGRAANITLGLPIIRTSVDHGTAFDLAGSGKADIGSLQTAIDVARNMVALRK